MNARLSLRSPASAFTPRLNRAHTARLTAFATVIFDCHLLRREPVVIGVVYGDGHMRVVVGRVAQVLRV